MSYLQPSQLARADLILIIRRISSQERMNESNYYASLA